MFKPNRLVWKKEAEGVADKTRGRLTNLSILGEMAKASNWSRILGRTTNKIVDGVNRAGTSTVDVVGRSALDAIQHLSITVRGAVANTLSPVLALDSDKTFGAKLLDSLKQVPASMVGRNLGNIGYGLAGVASSITGVDVDTEAKEQKWYQRLRLKRGIGISGIAWKLLGGSGDIVGSLYGADIVSGATEEMHSDNAELEKRWRLGMVTPFYRVTSPDEKGKQAQHPKPKEEKKEE